MTEQRYIDTDLTLRPSEEAKICLFCDRKKCNYGKCKTLKNKLKELRNREREKQNGT